MSATLRTLLAVGTFALLALLPAACASSGSSGVQQTVTVILELKNDLPGTPPMEVFVLPVKGDWHDRIDAGVVEGNTETRYNVRVPDTGRYTLYARPVVRPGGAGVFPFDRASEPSSRRSRRFTLDATTRRIEWRLRTNSLETYEDPGGGP